MQNTDDYDTILYYGGEKVIIITVLSNLVTTDVVFSKRSEDREVQEKVTLAC